jgi:hypothetical protein
MYLSWWFMATGHEDIVLRVNIHDGEHMEENINGMDFSVL